ncbi:MAG TPA: DUF5678 domain-containing protein [Promineifilum sp.]|nr:DUF5678 domain-containing protein [Promineifilum sp.]
MSIQIIVDLPDHIYRRLESLARQSQRDVNAVITEVVSRSVQPFPVDANRAAMLREVEAFRVLQPTLWHDLPNEHVAILDGKLVDHDADPVALLQRIRRDYPGRTVLRRKVGPASDRVLRFRSPRLSPRP